MAYIPDSELNGFNPLKAIGRALGSTGRVIAGTVSNIFVPGSGAIVQGALDAGAKMPGGKTTPAAPVATPAGSRPAPSGNNQTAANSSTLVATQAGSQAGGNAIIDAVQAMIAKLPQPQVQPTQQPLIIQQPAQATYAPPVPASATPAWLMPVAIGGAALLLVMNMKK